MPLEAGKLLASKRGSGQDLLALRDYQPNDDLRRVDWKATARTRHLIVREFAAEDDKRVTIFLDPRVPAEGERLMTLREKLEAEQQGKSFVLSERFERGVSLAASLLAHFTEQQADIRLAIGDGIGEYGIGNRHLYECLKRLAVADPETIEEQIVAAPDVVSLEAFDEKSDSHAFFLTAFSENNLPADLIEKVKIVLF